MLTTRYLLPLALYISATYAGTPSLVNETACTLELDIEANCTGERIGKETVNPQETYVFLTKYNDVPLPYNQPFCLTVKATCNDTLIQNVQTISPNFHERCLIRYHDEKNNEKTLILSPECSAPKTP